MTDETTNLVLEILRKVQGDIAFIRHDVTELKTSVILIRQDINTLKGDLLRQEHAIALLDTRVERIENRLNLSDA